MIAIAGVELETLVSEPDALTTRPPPMLKIDRSFKTNVALESDVYVYLYVF